MCTTVYAALMGAKEGIQPPETGVTDGCDLLVYVLGFELGSSAIAATILNH